MESLIYTFKLPTIGKFTTIQGIVVMGYQRTGNKFFVSFNGSKGYLSNIEISCEGKQAKRNNIIWIENLRDEGGVLPSKKVGIWYSEETGVRVQIEGVKEEKPIPPEDAALLQSSVDFQSDKDVLPF